MFLCCYCFRDIVRNSGRKSWIFFTHLYLTIQSRVTLWAFRHNVWFEKTGKMTFNNKKKFDDILLSALLTQLISLISTTDRQTDRRTDRITIATSSLYGETFSMMKRLDKGQIPLRYRGRRPGFRQVRAGLRPACDFFWVESRSHTGSSYLDKLGSSWSATWSATGQRNGIWYPNK